MPPIPTPPEAPDQTVSALPSAMLLALTGGMLDAIVFLTHGHVFANAMTGNVVLLGIALATRNLGGILAPLVPILAFLTGVLASRFLRRISIYPATLAALSLEVLTLLVLALLPATFPHRIFVATVAFVSAFQVSTFHRVGEFSYNSTFTTGNLRDTMDALYSSLAPTSEAERPEARQHLRDLGSICLCFLLGATAGAVVATRIPAQALFCAIPPLLVVLARVLLRHRLPPAVRA